jgi:hypothetical protein
MTELVVEREIDWKIINPGGYWVLDWCQKVHVIMNISFAIG